MKKLTFLFIVLTSFFITSCCEDPNIPELVCTADWTNVTTFGGNDGTFTLTVTGGIPPYTYSKNNGTSYQSSNVFTDLIAGTYLAKVKDSENNIASYSFTITQPNLSVLTATTTVVNVSGYGENDGKITVNARGGVKPYTYNIDGGTFTTDSVFSGLTAKSYTIVVKDSYTPNNSITLNNVIISQPTQLSATITKTNPLCNGNNGTITINVTSGTPPYTYSLDGGIPQNSNVFNVVAGTYTITVKDVYNTLVLSDNVIIQPTILSATFIKTDALCNGGNGSITITANGGTPPYTYKLNDNNLQTSNEFYITSGTYDVTIKDVNDCMITLNDIMISQPTEITVTTDVVNVTTLGGNNGSITVSVSGGISPYTYSLNDGTFGSNNVFNGLSFGTYKITVKDDNGCTITTSNISVTQPPINVGDSYLGGIVCSVDDNGHGFVVYPTNNIDLICGEANIICNSLGTGWRLPTETELNILFQSAKVNDIYGLGTGRFWTSTQPNSEYITYGKISDTEINFRDIPIDGSTKYKSRAVKSF